ncbi:MAG: hypothetical protein FWE41_06275 [Coriobacteriia bacterium]|nr:hypothetical protein [Coriobacteriia bacterium]MCL2750921.1 hypothetical protein [Coriobacteriia bacterium]
MDIPTSLSCYVDSIIKDIGTGGRGWNRGTGLVFQFDLGQIGTLTPSPCSKPLNA